MDFNDSDVVWRRPEWIERSQSLLNSYRYWVGTELIVRSTPEQDSRTLFEAPFVAVAHGTEQDPLLNYGNQTALSLWKMTLADFVGTPSRHTAEPMHRDERATLMDRTRRDGFIDDYSGIRIASTGERFRIVQATVWNVLNERQVHIGQAATFTDWIALP